MAFIILPRVFLLLLMTLMIISVSGTKQHALKEDSTTLNCPYICQERIYEAAKIPCCCQTCCPNNKHCFPGGGASIKATDATKLLGTIDIVLENENHNIVQVLADLTTRRNFITSRLVEDLGLGESVRKLNETDVRSIEIGRRNLTITEFVFLNISTGNNDSCLRDKIFEVIPTQNRERDGLVLPNLVVSLNFLYDAGALAINPAVFTGDEGEALDQSDEDTGFRHDRDEL